MLDPEKLVYIKEDFIPAFTLSLMEGSRRYVDLEACGEERYE